MALAYVFVKLGVSNIDTWLKVWDIDEKLYLWIPLIISIFDVIFLYNTHIQWPYNYRNI